jgi:hypothetical protein
MKNWHVFVLGSIILYGSDKYLVALVYGILATASFYFEDINPKLGNRKIF